MSRINVEKHLKNDNVLMSESEKRELLNKIEQTRPLFFDDRGRLVVCID